jgi:serine phosphatase RsbU (regulator of sigma subunit)
VIRYGEDELRAFTLLAQLIAMKITNTRLLEAEREQERLRQEMATAARIQANLLPKMMPEIPGYEIAARQIPCEAVGGDLYDVLCDADGIVSFVLGDVSGKGIGAALLMSHLMACIRTLHGESLDPVQVVEKVHRQLLHSSEASRYATLVYARLDPTRHELTYINAGHVQPLLVHPDGSVESLESTSMPVGLLADATFESRSLELRPGSTLILCSDGITEAESKDGDLFGDERFMDTVRGGGPGAAGVVLDHLLDEVRAFSGGIAITDDTTILVLSRPADGTRPESLPESR